MQCGKKCEIAEKWEEQDGEKCGKVAVSYVMGYGGNDVGNKGEA